MKVLSDAIAKASKDPVLQDKVHAQGISQQVLSLEAFDSYINNDVARLAPLIDGIADKR